MQWLGFTLNGISLLGITLVTGILVDDAIVEIENIVRHIGMGVPPYEASEEAANEIGLTVIAISFSIVAVFAPVSFMGGIPGQYFKQFGLTVAVSVLFSLLVARIITPMMAAYLMRGTATAADERDGFVMRALMAVLRWTMRHRGLTLLAGVGDLRRLDLFGDAAADRIHSCLGRRPQPDRDRAAAWSDHRRHRGRRAEPVAPASRGARGAVGLCL